MEYSHMGIPTQTPREGESYMEGIKLHLTDFQKDPFGVEWLRFEEGSPMPEPIQKMPHVAFKVDDLEEAIKGYEVIVEPMDVDETLRIAFILNDGVPVELMQYS